MLSPVGVTVPPILNSQRARKLLTGRGGLGMGLGDAPENSQDTGWFVQGEKIDLLAEDKPDRLI